MKINICSRKGDILRICIIPTMFPRFEGDYYGPFVFNEAKALVKKGFEVHVVTPHNQGAVYEEIMDGIQVHRFRWWEPKPFKALVYFKGLKDYIRLLTYLISLFFCLIQINRKYNIEIMHAHSVIPTGFVGAIIAKLLNVPFFITAHGMDVYNFEKYSIFRHILLFSLNSGDSAIAVSEDLVEKMRFLGVDVNKIVLLMNAVDTERFKPARNKLLRNKYHIHDKELLILFVGYLDVFKGIFEILNAFHNLKNKSSNLKLMMVGGGPKESELKTLVSEFDLEDAVIFTGEVKPGIIQEYYQAADIFVLPSHIKGVPVVVIEAMACGLPVVVSNTEIVEDGLNGFLVPHNNSELLANKIEILVNDPVLREKFRKESIKTINKEFNINIKVEKLIKLYKNSL